MKSLDGGPRGPGMQESEWPCVSFLAPHWEDGAGGQGAFDRLIFEFSLLRVRYVHF